MKILFFMSLMFTSITVNSSSFIYGAEVVSDENVDEQRVCEKVAQIMQDLRIIQGIGFLSYHRIQGTRQELLFSLNADKSQLLSYWILYKNCVFRPTQLWMNALRDFTDSATDMTRTRTDTQSIIPILLAIISKITQEQEVCYKLHEWSENLTYNCRSGDPEAIDLISKISQTLFQLNKILNAAQKCGISLAEYIVTACKLLQQYAPANYLERSQYSSAMGRVESILRLTLDVVKAQSPQAETYLIEEQSTNLYALEQLLTQVAHDSESPNSVLSHNCLYFV